MRKLHTIVLGAVMACSLVACGTAEPKKTERPAGLANMVNPYITCKTEKEMVKLAGFPMEEMRRFPRYVDKKILRVIPRKLIEVIYVDAKGAEVVRLRKAPGVKDVSGVYGGDTSVTTKRVKDNHEVILKGTAGKVTTALWTKDGYSYALIVKEALYEGEVLAILP